MSKKCYIGLSFLVLFLLLIADGAALAATKAERVRRAQELVDEALHRETYGWDDERRELLQRALEEDERCAAARWHQGYVRYQNAWMAIDQIQEAMSQDDRLSAYYTKRDEAPDTAQGHLDLAAWCRKRGLAQQERAHLMRVLQFEPDNSDVRRKLGFRRVAGDWMSRDELAAADQEAQRLRASLARWQPELTRLRASLRDNNAQRRQVAIDRLLAIEDPSAIPAMERVLSASNEEAALQVVEAISRMHGHEASQSLARHALLPPWERVRRAATEHLKSRDLQDYVPQLLGVMYSPVSSRMDVFRGDRGRLMYRHSFTREAQDHREAMVLDSEYQRNAAPGGDGRDTLGRAVMDLVLTARQLELNVARQNVLTNIMNQRIADILNTTTDQQLPPSAEDWWKWWEDENEVYSVGLKPVRRTYRTREVEVADRVALGTSGSRMECLAAGTPVWTIRGMVAIEQIKVGDLVLAQDPNSGELTYKPVLRTTIRPSSQLVKLQVGDETIEASGGHLFWVSGEGWIRARKLEPGMLLHGVDQTVHISSVEVGSEQQTYNLIVDQFHSYFVGKGRILSHDNTVRRPTDAVVPGLVH